jgi:NAD(P)-dependent dehydrogenase (short-subunit alcohol dehydrogenase family)
LGGLTCIVTGGARGIGYGIAARFGMEGATRVAIVDVDSTLIDAACQSLNETVPTCHFYGHTCDVGDEESVNGVWAKIAEGNGGRIDILVQAAGVSDRSS